MADGEVKQKKRKISDVFKRKNKDIQEEDKVEADSLDAKENEGQIEDESGEKSVESANAQDSHEKKKKKFGHGRFLSSRRKKSKSILHEDRKSETESLKGAEDENPATDGEKVEKLEKEEEEKDDEEELVEEKGSNEPLEDIKGDELASEVYVQVKSDTPEAVILSDNRETAIQTIENNEQLEDVVRLKLEEQNSEEGSVIRSLLRQGIPTEAAKTNEQQDSTKQDQGGQQSNSNEMTRFIPNIFFTIIPGTKSNNTGYPSETMYKLVLQTAGQTYSTLVNLIYVLLTRARQIPREVLVSILIYLIKKYPQCFKIKKVKRKKNLPESEVPVDTVN